MDTYGTTDILRVYEGKPHRNCRKSHSNADRRGALFGKEHDYEWLREREIICVGQSLHPNNCLLTQDTAEESLPQWIPRIPRSLLRNGKRAITQTDAGTTNPGWESSQPRHAVIALGGTFDHLHVGHKILLSMAAWITERKIIVGVTDDCLLTKKSNREVLETIEQRMEGVRRFLELFRPDLVHEVVPISDVYGPTGFDPDIQALVVSKETLSGAQSIAKLRHERNLPGLETYVIEVISGNATDELVGEEDAEKLKTAKMSSSYIRQWIVEQNQK
ncbi:hypothetical protein FRC17_004671 [Serendipita sp. 399]|nr:hypothetical protein FRC17_004671 [Serendipita sp. 399]